jgi:hypothetical protein
MHKRNVKFVVSLAIAGAVVLAVSTGLASASGTSGGEVHAYEADTNVAGSVGTVVFTGAVTDTGFDEQGYNPDGSNEMVLSKGSLAVDVSKVANKLNPVVDPTTCSAHDTATGPVRIVPNTGTRAYQRLTGTIDVQVSVAYILPGAPGACETNATQYPGVLVIKGSGTVSYNGNQ